jgi:hypothetical protein
MVNRFVFLQCGNILSLGVQNTVTAAGVGHVVGKVSFEPRRILGLESIVLFLLDLEQNALVVSWLGESCHGSCCEQKR